MITAAVKFGLLSQVSQTCCHLDVDTATIIPALPYDVRTAIANLSIEPTITWSICHPKCYSKYSVKSMPEICIRKETPRSRCCGKKLWTIRSTQSGPHRVPRHLYSTQDFHTWLEWFLSWPGIEDLINKSYDHHPPVVLVSDQRHMQDEATMLTFRLEAAMTACQFPQIRIVAWLLDSAVQDMVSDMLASNSGTYGTASEWPKIIRYHKRRSISFVLVNAAASQAYLWSLPQWTLIVSIIPNSHLVLSNYDSQINFIASSQVMGTRSSPTHLPPISRSSGDGELLYFT